MPLQHSSSDSAFKTNVKTLMGEVGKSPHVKNRDQALAIAYAVKRRGKAFGGATAPWQVRQEAKGMTHTGPIMSAVPGRTDRHNMNLASGSYVVPAQAVSHLGENNTMAGFNVLHSMFGTGGTYNPAPAIARGQGAPSAPRPPKIAHGGALDNGGARGDDTGKPVPVVTAGGEYVIDPHVVHAIGAPIAAKMGGDPVTRGHEALDQWINKIKQDHIKTLKKLPGPAKS
jgi:hypothetical protein